MKPLIKFWIASTLVIALLSWWPLHQFETWSENSSSARNQVEASMAEEARLIEHFALDENPAGKGRASNPKTWEAALGARISLRETAGEALGQIGGPAEYAVALSKLKPGMGLLVDNERGRHYIYDTKSAGRGQFLVISREGRSAQDFGTLQRSLPSAAAMTLALSLVGGVLMTFLAKIALLTPATGAGRRPA